MKNMYDKCPECGSKNLKKENDDLIGEYIICLDCGFDESLEYDVYPDEKKSQKAKGSYSVYKHGGGRRSVK